MELPEVPRLETDLYVPLGTQRASGLDLIEDSDFIVGDSTGAEPLSFLVTGEIDTFRVDEVLDFETPHAQFSASVERIVFPNPDDFDELFTIGELIDLPLAEHGTGIAGDIVIPPFVLPTLRRALPPQDAFDWIRFSEGRIRFIVENDLPIPVGDGTSAIAIGLRLRDRNTSEVVLQTEIRGRILPGASATRTFFLEGVSARRLLDLEIYGRSEGSTSPVEVEFSQGIRVIADFQEIAPDSVVAEVPAQTITIADTLDFELDEDLAVFSGTVRTGRIPVRIENELRLSATGTLVFPEIIRGAQPVRLDIALPAGRINQPGIYEGTLDIGGATLVGSGDRALRSIRYELQVAAAASSTPIALGRRQEVRGVLSPADLSFDSIEANAQGREIEVPDTSQPIEPPEALEDLDFTRASAAVRVETTVGIPAAARLRVRAIPEAEGPAIEFPVDFDIPAAAGASPVSTRHVLTEADAPLLELIRARPTRVELLGNVILDPKGTRGILRRDDWLRATYELAAPFVLRFENVAYESDAFRFTVGEEAQERIREDVKHARATGVVENHLPTAVSMQLQFASSEERLVTDPEIVVETIELASGEVDPLTGRVVRAVASEFDVSLPQTDVDFFARDEVFARFVFLFDSETSEPVLVTATDYVEARALLKFRVALGDQWR